MLFAWASESGQRHQHPTGCVGPPENSAAAPRPQLALRMPWGSRYFIVRVSNACEQLPCTGTGCEHSAQRPKETCELKVTCDMRHCYIYIYIYVSMYSISSTSTVWPSPVFSSCPRTTIDLQISCKVIDRLPHLQHPLQAIISVFFIPASWCNQPCVATRNCYERPVCSTYLITILQKEN